MISALVQYFFLRTAQLSYTHNYLKDTVQATPLLRCKRIEPVFNYTCGPLRARQRRRSHGRLSADISELMHEPCQSPVQRPPRREAMVRTTKRLFEAGDYLAWSLRAAA